MLLTIILPAFNEETGIQETIRKIPLHAIHSLGYMVNLLVIDNNSTDNTPYYAKKSGATVIHEYKQGYGYTLKKSFQNIRSGIIFVCDSDNSYPVQDLPFMLNIFTNENLDFLSTNRFPKKQLLQNNNMSFLNQLGNRFLTLLCFIIFHIPLKDSQSGMWIAKQNIIRQSKLKSNQMNLSQEIKIDAIFYQKCRWREIDINYSKRIGRSKLKRFSNGIENIYSLFLKRIWR